MKKYIVLKNDIQSHQIVRCNAIELLESKGLSVAELARRGDISYTTLVVIIKEGYEPKEQSIAHIAKGFDMTLAEFFSSKGECILKDPIEIDFMEGYRNADFETRMKIWRLLYPE